MSASFQRLARVDARIMRGPAVVDGKRNESGAVVATVKITPFAAASSEIVQRMALETPTKLLTAYCAGGLSVQEGDSLVVDGVEYPIKGCSPYADFCGEGTFELVVEDLRV